VYPIDNNDNKRKRKEGERGKSIFGQTKGDGYCAQSGGVGIPKIGVTK
jgi:hypothetical protein